MMCINEDSKSICLINYARELLHLSHTFKHEVDGVSSTRAPKDVWLQHIQHVLCCHIVGGIVSDHLDYILCTNFLNAAVYILKY